MSSSKKSSHKKGHRSQEKSKIKEYELGDFEMLQTIASGSFGRVMLCKNPQQKYFSIKIMSITNTISIGQTIHTMDEKVILKEIKHPFINELLATFKDDKFLYMLFPFYGGGDLFFHLRRKSKFDLDTCLFYSCEIVSAFDYLHSLSIVYRNLKPENILLDNQGHVILADFGFVKSLKNLAPGTKTYTLCGTPEYLAPELVLGKGHDKAVDWWSLGILIFEMLSGSTPFYASDITAIYKKILVGAVHWPIYIDPVSKDLIKKLLGNRPSIRLCRAVDVKEHRWFKSIDWKDVLEKNNSPPILPTLKNDGDASNYDDFEEGDWRNVSEPTEDDKALFERF